jgi:hypothetical protein
VNTLVGVGAGGGTVGVVESKGRRTSCTTRVTTVELLSASGSSKSTPAAAVRLGAFSPGPTTRTKRTSFVDGSLRTIAQSSWPSMSPSRARLTITSCLFHSSIVSANDALSAIDTSAPPASSARASAVARASSGSTSRAFMPTPPR